MLFFSGRQARTLSTETSRGTSEEAGQGCEGKASWRRRRGRRRGNQESGEDQRCWSRREATTIQEETRLRVSPTTNRETSRCSCCRAVGRVEHSCGAREGEGAAEGDAGNDVEGLEWQDYERLAKEIANERYEARRGSDREVEVGGQKG